MTAFETKMLLDPRQLVFNKRLFIYFCVVMFYFVLCLPVMLCGISLGPPAHFGNTHKFCSSQAVVSAIPPPVVSLVEGGEFLDAVWFADLEFSCPR